MIDHVLRKCVIQPTEICEFLHLFKARSGLNDMYQSHKNIIAHSTLRNFLQMAHQHNIAACTPGSKLNDSMPTDMPTDMNSQGIKKLWMFARETKLGRFHWLKAGGSHAQADLGGESSAHKSVSE